MRGGPLFLAFWIAAAAHVTPMGQAAAQATHFQAIRFQADASAPIRLKTDKLVWQQNDRRASLNGAARISQGRITLSADNMRLRMDDNGLAQHLEARQNVMVFDEAQRATADKADYDLQAERLILSGNVRVTQKTNASAGRTLSGGRLEINMVSGLAKLTGSGKNRARIKLK